MSIQRVLVIGLDGAGLDLIRPWAEGGKLPFLAQVMRHGAWGELESVTPVVSAAAWTSFMTGQNPARHGVFDFTHREPGSYHLRVTQRTQEPTLWGILSAQGRRVGVINVPQTYPPEAVNGFLISGLGTPTGRVFTYPAALSETLRARGYRVNNDVAYRPGNEEAFLQDICETTDSRARVALGLMREWDWDLFMVVFRNSDEVMHFMWRHMDPSHPLFTGEEAYRDAILRYYQMVDGWMARLAEAAGPEATLLIVSDHGAGPLYRDVFLNEWLRQEGLLSLREKPGMPSMVTGALRRVGLTRSGMGAHLSKLGLGRLRAFLGDALEDRMALIPNDERLRLAEAVDWSRTRAYSIGYIGQIYINLRGREPQGIVEPGEEYETLRDHLIARLHTLRDPEDGGKVVDHVLKREEVYEGPYVSAAADLLVTMRGLAYVTRDGYELSTGGSIFSAPMNHESGGHRPEGVLMAMGPAIVQGRSIRAASITDMTPTILYMLGCGVPEGMDGRIVSDLFHPDHLTAYPIRYTGDLGKPGSVERPWSEEDEDEIMERLKRLGYLG